MATPILYSFRRCPYAMRARMALLASGQQVELREVRLRDKPVEMIAASPKATVPVLVDADGQVIDESLDIMLWALRRDDPESWLPTTKAGLADELVFIAACDGDFKTSLDRYKYADRDAVAVAQDYRERGAVFLICLQHKLEVSAWLGGDHAGLADYAIMPFVRQFAAVDNAWFEDQDWPQLKAWLNRLGESRLFVEAMQRFDPWTAHGPANLFPADTACR